MEKIKFQLDDGTVEEFYVEEQTRIGGISYIMVSDSLEDEATVYIMKDVSEDTSKEEVSPETYTVRKGDTFSDFTITKITADSVSIRSEYSEYYTDLRKDGALLESLGIANEFTLKPGETLVLTDAGLCDATHTVYIACVSID